MNRHATIYGTDGKPLDALDEADLRDLISAGKATVVRGPHNERAVYLKNAAVTVRPHREVPHRAAGRRRGGIRYAGTDAARSAAVDEILKRRRADLGICAH